MRNVPGEGFKLYHLWDDVAKCCRAR